MHTKLLITLATLAVYSMTLVLFQQNQSLAERRYQRLARSAPTSGFQLECLANQLGDLVQSPPSLKAANQVAAQPAKPPCDPVLRQTIQEYNRELSVAEAEQLARLIEGTAAMYGVDPYLVTALLSQESAFRQNAVSPVGALGLGQLMPETAFELGVDPRDPEQNLEGCVRYLAQNLETWSHSEDPVALALASYNAGPGAVQRYGGIPPYQETQHYVAVIKYRYDQLRAQGA